MMNLTITKDLIRKFKNMLRIIDTKTTAKSPKGFLINGAEISVYNHELSAKYTLSNEELGLVPELAVSPFILPIKAIQLIMSLPIDTAFVIKCDKNKVIITTKKPKTHSQFATENAAIFPEIPTVVDAIKTTIDGSIFAEIIKTALLGADENSIQPVSSTVRFNSSQKRLDVMSTDSFVMVVQQIAYESDFNMNVPAKSLRSLLPFIGSECITVGLAGNQRHASFQMDNLVLFSRLLDMQSIDYEAFCCEKENKVTINKAQLYSVLERALLSQDTEKKVQFHIADGNLNISIKSSTNEYQECIPLVNQTTAKHTCTVNGKFMLDTLKAFLTKEDDEIIFSYESNELKPVLLMTKKKDLFGIVVPIRTKK